ncbi:MAG: hypothetical protein R2860_04515 [Desulfobacterales bacterium]
MIYSIYPAKQWIYRCCQHSRKERFLTFICPGHGVRRCRTLKSGVGPLPGGTRELHSGGGR